MRKAPGVIRGLCGCYGSLLSAPFFGNVGRLRFLPLRISASAWRSFRRSWSHSSEHVTRGVLHSNFFPQIMQTFVRLDTRRSLVCWRRRSLCSSPYSRALRRMFSAVAASLQLGQYFWFPLVTMYSPPHASHLSMLPMGRCGPLAFTLRSASARRSALQSGQYHARGPPRKVTPHWRHTRGLSVACLWYATEQSGHRLLSRLREANSLPQRWQIRFAIMRLLSSAPPHGGGMARSLIACCVTS